MGKINYNLPTGSQVTAGVMSEIKESVNALYDQNGSYKSYVAYVLQQGEGNLLPSFTVIKNTLSGNITWSQSSDGMGGYETGIFIGTLNGAFVSGKTAIFSTVAGRQIIEGYYSSVNAIGLENLKLTDGTLTNKVFGNIIEIRVYD